MNSSHPEISQPDTIYALATATGKSAIAVIRISGPLSQRVPALFGQEIVPPKQIKVMRLTASDGQVIDEVVYFCFQSPHSATGEDAAEIQCHGSAAVISAIMAILGDADGLRMAEAGEFTKRSIDNGKMDITAAEGLADLIDSETARQRQQATAQMFGRLSTPVSVWREQIIAQAALIESLIDFADEELPDGLEDEIHQKISDIIQQCEIALDDGHIGEMIRSGIELAIIGPVNAGKSTTLNALARRPAAIVSAEEGTTRDVVEVKLDLNGIPVTLMDTAGFRKTENHIENQGIELAVARAEAADFRLILCDVTQPDWSEQAKKCLTLGNSGAIIVANKTDRLERSDLTVYPHNIDDVEVMFLSLQNNADIEQLENRLTEAIAEITGNKTDPLITRQRHRQSLMNATKHLYQAQRYSIDTQTELVAEEYRAAAASLSRILGIIDVEEVLGHIFSRFCIGK